MGRRSTLPPLTREQQDRATSCLDRTRNKAYRFARRRGRLHDLRDIQSDAFIGLCHAARAFDPARNNNFPPYSDARIIGAMLDGLRYRSPLARSHHAQGAKPPVFLSLDEKKPDEAAPVGFDLEQEDEIRWLMGPGLSQRDRHVIRRFYIDGIDQTAIARELNVCPSRVSQLRSRALKTIRERHGVAAGE